VDTDMPLAEFEAWANASTLEVTGIAERKNYTKADGYALALDQLDARPIAECGSITND
jgi:hypothetical protein